MPQKESIKTLHILYPIFKEEVYRRRAAMARISRRGSLLFVSLSILILFNPERLLFSPSLKSLVIIGIGLATALLVTQIIQEKRRHEKAKRQLITLEKGLGLFESGRYLPEETLYPVEWQESPGRDAGMILSLVGVIGTGIVLSLIVLIL
ncbi:MAG: hypothetical protein ABGX83_00465 [Nitrospira sp.]|nr:hypothetical protein [Candidatus Manganitrophaceae bacterium]HIL34745.1 hypothetical protein [Candidatus Manganitrophaceae bacterium]